MIGNLLILFATFAILCQHASAQYTLSAFAGTGTQGSDGDNGPATSAKLNFVPSVWTDSSGQTFIVDYSANNIRRVDTSGIIKTIGGTGSASVASSGGAFTSVDLYSPWGLFGDTAGTTLYISDNYHVWKYNRASGIVSILAGTGSQGTAGDGGPAISAQINKANGLWLATTNILYIGEYGNNLVRMINLNTGIISTYAGGGGAGLGGDGGPAVSTNTKLNSPQGIYLDTNGQLFVADRSNGRIRLIAGGIITTYAGGGPSSNTADGYAATNAYFSSPFDVKGDSIGNIFIVEGANRVRVVDYSTKVVTLYMSTGLSAPRGIWLDRVNGRSLVGMLGYVKSAPLYVNPVSTSAPSAAPTTAVPTVAPTILQTASPSAIPTASPSAQPTFQPTFKPTAVPSAIPSAVPTKAPTVNPSVTPTAIPSFAPTTVPTVNPSAAPTRSPTAKPTVAPTASPTAKPTAKPSTAAPSELPTFMPSPVPGVPTAIPTIAPSETPTATPTFNPSAVPTASPSEIPTATPTAEPTATPSAAPTAAPSEIPTQTPTAMPSAIPTEAPTATPTTTPTAVPSAIPTHSPTEVPTANPTFTPTAVPSEIPSAVPSATPTYVPTATPTYVPTPAPSAQPSSRPTSQPSGSPTQPTLRPTDAPTAVPTVKNPDIVQVSGVSRVKFVNGASLNDLSLSTLLAAFENISVNAFTTVITSSVLVAQSTNNNGGSRRRLTTTFGYYTYDIGFVSSYLMANYPAHTSSQVAAMKSNIIQQKIQVGAFENTLRSMAKDRSAYQLLNGTCNEVTSITTSIITPTTPTTGTTSSSSSSSSLSAGIIAAIVIGVLFGSLLLGFILFVILKRYENSNKKKKLTVERKDSRYSVVL